MGLTLNQQQNFGTRSKDPNVHGDNIYFTTGGATVVNWTWVNYPNRKIDLKQVITDYLKTVSRRIFNQKNGILYVLVGLDDSKNVVVLPSLSYNKTTTGDIKAFDNLGGVLPLAIVKLQQDGSDGLTGILNIKPEDLEIYTGWGNFTIAGDQGNTGPKGLTGIQGVTGYPGITGFYGDRGPLGFTGLPGVPVQGDTGLKGPDGARSYSILIERVAAPIVDFSGNPLSGQAPLTVVFTNLTAPSDSVTNWLWSFGDGNGSTDENPTNVYYAQGVYTVSLTATTEDGDFTETKTDYITVTGESWIQDNIDNITYENWQTTNNEADPGLQNITQFPG